MKTSESSHKNFHLSEKILPRLLKDNVSRDVKRIVHDLACLYGQYVPSQDELHSDILILSEKYVIKYNKELVCFVEMYIPQKLTCV